MMPPLTLVSTHEIPIEIGGVPILVRTVSSEFARMLADRYGEFVSQIQLPPTMELEVRLISESAMRDRVSGADDDGDEDVHVQFVSGRWIMSRGDFRAEWDPECRLGWVRQTANPYAFDSVLRILHSLILAKSGGFLVHAASAVRNGRAFIFAGESGAGKTTLSRLAPPDVTVLTDEISYLKPAAGNSRGTNGRGYEAFGTPFAGELARVGEKTRAPLAALFLLKQGSENRVESVTEPEAAWELFRHVLFFARDEESVRKIFQSILEFVASVPVQRLVFAPEADVWELIE